MLHVSILVEIPRVCLRRSLGQISEPWTRLKASVVEHSPPLMRGPLNSVSFFRRPFKRSAASAVQQMPVAVTDLASSKRLFLNYADAVRRTKTSPRRPQHVAVERSPSRQAPTFIFSRYRRGSRDRNRALCCIATYPSHPGSTSGRTYSRGCQRRTVSVGSDKSLRLVLRFSATGQGPAKP